MLSIDELRKSILPVVNEFNINKIIIFGSYARGEQTQTSDIDIIIDSGGRLKGLAFFGLVRKISNALPVPVDVFELSEVNNPSPTYTAIMEDGVVIYESTR